MKISNPSRQGSVDEKSWPTGFRFHPTDEELVLYYLKRKICRRRLEINIIGETDVYKWEPEDLPGRSILKTGDRQWFFFSPRDRKYPNGARSNRATRYGYWKATGKDRNITCNKRSVGVKKTLVFYEGRAPNGKRTDWVMHEYTLDEDELKRCQTAQDYYALYKVYKKSGPGPKNGEQYGAPFKEEEWAEDDDPVVGNDVGQENPVKQPTGDTCVNTVRVDSQLHSPPTDLEEILNNLWDLDQQSMDINSLQAVNELDEQSMDGYASAPTQVVGEEEPHGSMADPSLREGSLREGIFTESNIALYPCGNLLGMQETGIGLTQSATSQLQLNDTSEVTSASNIGEPERNHVIEEDYLEMDDLFGPEPTLQGEKPIEKLLLDDIDGLSELELFHDAAMFIRDVGPLDEGIVSNNYNSMVTVCDYQLQSHPDDADEITTQLWVHHDQRSVHTSAEANQFTISSATQGMPFDSSSTYTPNDANSNQIQSGRESSSGGGGFASALWAFVDSIPTTPASASENALVNRAFERMSSFGRLRMHGRNSNLVAGNNTGATMRSWGRNKGFFFFSVLVAVFAILCVLIGSYRVLETYISS